MLNAFLSEQVQRCSLELTLHSLLHAAVGLSEHGPKEFLSDSNMMVVYLEHMVSKHQPFMFSQNILDCSNASKAKNWVRSFDCLCCQAQVFQSVLDQQKCSGTIPRLFCLNVTSELVS